MHHYKFVHKENHSPFVKTRDKGSLERQNSAPFVMRSPDCKHAFNARARDRAPPSQTGCFSRPPAAYNKAESIYIIDTLLTSAINITNISSIN